MGEIADQMLGIDPYSQMCEMCGVYLEGPPSGFPRYCSKECADDRGGEFVPGRDREIGTEGEEVTK